jgi:hypothetical protein
MVALLIEFLVIVKVFWKATGAEPPAPQYLHPCIKTEIQNYVLKVFLLFELWGYLHCGHSWPIVPASGDSEDDCGEADEI